MGLTQKILLFASALVVALVATTLAFTTFQANQLARFTINQGLKETREVWETFQADRYKQLKLGIRVLGNDPAFKAAVANREDQAVRQATVLDMLRERGQDLKADFFIATDPSSGCMLPRARWLPLVRAPLARPCWHRRQPDCSAAAFPAARR